MHEREKNSLSLELWQLVLTNTPEIFLLPALNVSLPPERLSYFLSAVPLQNFKVTDVRLFAQLVVTEVPSALNVTETALEQELPPANDSFGLSPTIVKAISTARKA